MNPKHFFTGIFLLSVLALAPLIGITASLAQRADPASSRLATPPGRAPNRAQADADPAAANLVESGRWEWAGAGALNDIFFLDATHGWAAGTGVWKTIDGGATWYRVPDLRTIGPRSKWFSLTPAEVMPSAKSPARAHHR